MVYAAATIMVELRSGERDAKSERENDGTEENQCDYHLSLP
jgi:hypothetical protein